MSQSGQERRFTSTDDDIEALVQQNIQDVLKTVNINDYDDYLSVSANPHPLSYAIQPISSSAAVPNEVESTTTKANPPTNRSSSTNSRTVASSRLALPSSSKPSPRVGVPSSSSTSAPLRQTSRTNKHTPLPSLSLSSSSRPGSQAAGSEASPSDLEIPEGLRVDPVDPEQPEDGSSPPLPPPLPLDVPGQPEASLRLHKARLTALEADFASATELIKVKGRENQELLKELKAVRAEKEGWARERKNLELQLDRAKKTASEAEAALQGHEQKAREMAKAEGKLERDRRQADAEQRGKDVRLTRALEELEKYRTLLAEAKSQDREGKDSARAEVSKLQTEIKKLERQRTELLAAFRKQMRLIELLRRQRVHLEASRALQFTEEEFLKILDMGGTT
eukprot:CAMPEP_0175085646 /NCGR_PEP_ID=MMETSP0052_2-20121109/28785_1 /TAXON_ID=51329 ORGANISM="Polytomella parva, Strain SAG 63-3" /NCGR_SAMPLE_ID=MMETSP0052_2 /ASSEMBLY_ACC=CAM_ASM_000194 /LENGTH=393 /DNA_ID=CAMNT_0016357693 /DNA_START=44 /DNA_END=1226 /DNA_ORIENTATION=-